MTKKEKLYLEAKEKYYQGDPILSDYEFDLLEEELKQLNSTVIDQVGAPETSAKKIPHLSPMLSLGKISADLNDTPPSEEFKKWWIKSGRPSSVEVQPKYDGNAISIQYKNGKFLKGLTRGDGLIGQDISEKLTNLVPLTVNYSGLIEVRGEMLMPLKTFEKKYQEFKNPRNLVAGILGQKEVNKEMLNDLHFVPYDVHVINKDKFDYIEDSTKFFKENKFKQLPATQICQLDSSDSNGKFVEREFNEIYKDHLKRRSTNNYQLDGIVIKLIGNETRKEFPGNSHHPGWALAIKFAPTLTTTTINDIFWSGGKTGALTPIALLEPVDLDGSTISKCSLYNYRAVIENKTLPGCYVSIKKCGDIIPAIDKIITPSTNKDYTFPTHCPRCNTELTNDGINLLCENPTCPDKLIGKIQTSIRLLNMDFFGESTIEKLVEAGYKTIFDILDPDQFNQDTLIKRGFKAGKSIDRLIDESMKVKKLDAWLILMLLGYDNLGRTTAKQLAKKYWGLNYSSHGLEKKFFDMIEDENVIDEIENAKRLLESFGIEIIIEDKNKLKDEKMEYIKNEYEMTGSPKPQFSKKEEFEEYAEKFGFVHTKLDKDCKLLLTDDYESSSSKMVKAKKMGIEIITYEDFVKKYK